MCVIHTHTNIYVYITVYVYTHTKDFNHKHKILELTSLIQMLLSIKYSFTSPFLTFPSYKSHYALDLSSPYFSYCTILTYLLFPFVYLTLCEYDDKEVHLNKLYAMISCIYVHLLRYLNHVR